MSSVTVLSAGLRQAEAAGVALKLKVVTIKYSGPKITEKILKAQPERLLLLRLLLVLLLLTDTARGLLLRPSVPGPGCRGPGAKRLQGREAY